MRGYRRRRIWRTQKGEDIQLRQMHVGHIRACIRKIERAYYAGKYWRLGMLLPLYSEIERRKTEARSA